jgi:peptide/nickel transport system permease protein
MIRLFKHPLFLIGFLVLAGLLVSSVLYSTYYYPDGYEPQKLLYDDNRRVIAAAPFKPSELPPLGSDRFGEPILYKVIDGAKYTLGIAFTIALLRLLFSFIFGVVISMSGKLINGFIKNLIEAFNYTPMTIIVYLMVTPVLVVYSWSFSEMEKMVIPFLVLVFVAVPTTTLLIAEEIKEIMKNEFIDNSKLLGGGKLHIIRKHVMPFLSPRLAIIYTQQVIGTLLIMAHLGVLKVFVGGSNNILIDELNGTTMPVAIYNEWAGMIGTSFRDLMMAKWIILGPIYGFIISIIALNFIVEGLKDTTLNYKVSKSKTSWRKRKKKKPEIKAEKTFQFVNNEANDDKVSSL